MPANMNRDLIQGGSFDKFDLPPNEKFLACLFQQTSHQADGIAYVAKCVHSLFPVLLEELNSVGNL